MVDNKLVSDYFKTAFDDKQRIIALSDGKANIVLGLIGIILSIFFGFVVTNNTDINFYVLLILIPFVLSGACAIFTVMPRIPKPSGNVSLLYFKDVVNLNNNILKNSKLFNSNNIYADYINNMKVLSSIIEKKFLFLRYSYFFLGLGVILKLSFEFMQWI